MRISRGLIIIIFSIIFLLTAVVIFLYDQGFFPEEWLAGFFKENKTIQAPISRGENEITVEEQIETATYESPAGFAFDYNKNFILDEHPEDTVNYANIDLTIPNKRGIINITVNDTKFKDINEWVVNDKLAASGSQLDTQIAGLAAKKVILPDSGGQVLAAFIDADQVLYLISMKPEKEDKFWSKNLEIILSSFALIPFEGEEEGSSRLLETGSAGSSKSDEEGAIYLPEEVIE